MLNDSARHPSPDESAAGPHQEPARKPLSLPMVLVREGFFRTTRRLISMEEAHEMNRKAAERDRSWF